jgi:hypothetical protein
MKLRIFLEQTDKIMSLNQFKRYVKKSGVYMTIYPGNSSRNWDGTWWQAIWSDGERDEVKITATKKFDGLPWCRQKATEEAYSVRAEREGIKIKF